jgi:hypothetical protein
MTKKWGCVLPRAHLHRGQHFLWRALKTQCLIHDESFLVPLLLSSALPANLLGTLGRLMVSIIAMYWNDTYPDLFFLVIHCRILCKPMPASAPSMSSIVTRCRNMR